MKNLYIFSLVALVSCGGAIKNENDKVVVEPGTEADFKKDDSSMIGKKQVVATNTVTVVKDQPEGPKADPNHELNEFIGFWVGDFEPKEDDYSKDIIAGDGFYWNRTNKINISLDSFAGNNVFGHSVVAGNDRPFKGTYSGVDGSGGYLIDVQEPGDNKYDGAFSFTIGNGKLSGTWKAYKEIDIQERAFELERAEFSYDASIQLEYTQPFVDYLNAKETKQVYEYEDEVEEWISTEYETATDAIYEVNASERLLSKDEVENMKRGDLLIIRNAIYARHGYSFKQRPLRIFFDAQPWYIPVHSDIRADFTEIEKTNIKLLLKYEKNAKEYYDSFGRG